MNDLNTAISPHHHVTVTASAGVGKTYLLVTRIARLLLEEVRPDAILAITFTRKAATEIYQRLMERLHTWATLSDEALSTALTHIDVSANEPYVSRARALYEKLLRKPARVQATTFHAFCQDLLRRFPLDADVPPGFTLLENTAPLRAAAWDALYHEAANNPQSDVANALEVLFNYTNSIHSTRVALDQFLNQRADWWAYTELAEKPVEFARTRLLELLNLDLSIDPIVAFAHANTGNLQRFGQLLGMHNTDTNHKFAQRLTQALLDTAQDQAWFSEVRGVFLNNDGEPRARKSSKAQRKSLGDDGEDEFLRLHTDLCSALMRVADDLKTRRAYTLNSHIYHVGARLIAFYQEIKREQRLLDFADLEWKAYQLLNHGDNAQWVQYKLDQRIDHLLVDEFQDTNPTQWRLLLPILQEFANTDERLRSAFIVGDAKQSIYRFRRADAGLLATAGEWLDAHLQGMRFPMDKSRRSAPAIIDLVNHVFTHSTLHHAMPDFVPHSTHQSHAWGNVEVWPLLPLPVETPPALAAWRNPLRSPRVIETDDRHYADGCRVAQHIQNVLAQSIAVTPHRTLDYSDVMILMRSRTHAEAYERALRDHHIPYLGIERGTLLDTQEAQDIVALLTTLAIPYDNLALVNVLRSPIFSFSDDDLIALAAQQSGAYWHARLEALALHAEAHITLKRAVTLLAQWHAASSLLPVHDLLDKIYCEGDILARYEAAYPAHLRGRVRGNLLQILALALATDSGRYPSLGRFLHELQDLREQDEGAPDIAAPYSGVPSVRMLTIHSAKGLEAPLVYLVDAASGSGKDRTYRTLVRWPSGNERPDYVGIALKQQDIDPFHRQLIAEHSQAQSREEANLLYVALTRARHQLVVTGIVPKMKDMATSWFQMIASALPWEDHTQVWSARNGTPDTRVNSASDVAAIAPVPEALCNLAPHTSDTRSARVESSAAQCRGACIHRFLELLGRGLTSTLATRQVAMEMQLPEDDPLLVQSVNEVTRLRSVPLFKEIFFPSGDTQVFHELPLTYYKDNILEYGVVDCLAIRGDHIQIIDYKSDRGVTEQNITDAAAAHADQLQRYANGVAQCWPDKTLEGVLIFTENAVVWRQQLSNDSPTLN